MTGANLGRWMDSTWAANVRFINGMETVGLLILDNLDNMLEQDKLDDKLGSRSNEDS